MDCNETTAAKKLITELDRVPSVELERVVRLRFDIYADDLEASSAIPLGRASCPAK
jgi:hypothetical protein